MAEVIDMADWRRRFVDPVRTGQAREPVKLERPPADASELCAEGEFQALCRLFYGDLEGCEEL